MLLWKSCGSSLHHCRRLYFGLRGVQWQYWLAVKCSLLPFIPLLPLSLSPGFIPRSDSQPSPVNWVSTIVRVKSCKERSGNEGDGKRNGRQDLLKLPNPYFSPTSTLSCLVHPQSGPAPSAKAVWGLSTHLLVPILLMTERNFCWRHHTFFS